MTVLTGNHVKYIKDGLEHNALVIHVHNQSLINLLYIALNPKDSDSFGNNRIIKTSIPYKEDAGDGYFLKTS